MQRVTLGPFVLGARIGKGGMAEVWRAVHMDDDVPVAVKVLTGERARRPRSVRQFRLEARAVARLDHPHVVGVHDVGEIPEAAARATGGALEAGSPYLVMDLLPGGTLWKYRGRLAWPDLKNLLHVLLDALAHAHARGVVHRDLKPSNVLLSPERRAVLSDFGLAYLPDADPIHLRAGTPSYMAPEQFLDRWRDFGPWTDLYGFGCLVWTLVAGQPPFRRLTWEETREAHLRADPPPLVPIQPVPDGLEAWLCGLLEKDPARRTQCAADASWALEHVEPDDVSTDDLIALVEPDDTLDTRHDMPSLSFGAAPAFAPTILSSVGRNDAPPPPPPDWRGPRALRRLHLRGAGLGLLGARAIPTVGRTAERDTLWRALVEVHRVPLARAIVLEGPSGTGKTHLARWLAQRASEVGAASALWVEHGARGGAMSGLAGMLRAHFGVEGLEPDAALARLVEVARSYGTTEVADQRVLAELVLDEPSQPGSPSDASVRLSALSRHLCAVGARRPLVIVVDDAQRGTDALLFARWLLRRREAEPTPVLFVLVVQDEGLARHRPSRDLLAQILQSDGTGRVRVEPLPDEDQLELIRELVGLEGELARRVAARTGGNPAFAVALVEDWVARGVLVRAEGGFRLRDGADASLPHDLHALWAAHVANALQGWPEAAWRGLELAAVLGMRVDVAEWSRIGARAGVSCSLDAVEALIARRLASSTRLSASWRFVHATVRETLIRRAHEAGRLVGLHRWVVEDLERRPHVDDQRMARHLLGAERTFEGVERLARAARALMQQGNAHAALDLCDTADQALARAPREAVARWRRFGSMQRARALLQLGRLDEGEAAAGALAADPTATPVERCDAGIVLATVGILRGRLEWSRDHLRDLEAEARAGGFAEQRARALRSLAIALHHLGELDGAVRAGTESRAEAARIGEWHTWAESTMQLAATMTELGHLTEAAQIADEALSARRDQQLHPGAVAGLLNLRAEIERRRGRHDLAVPLYERSVDLLDRMGSLEAVLPRLNLAAIHALEGRYGEAFRLAERCRRESALQGRPPLELAVRSVLLVAALGLSDDLAWEQQATRILELAQMGVTTESDAYALVGLACRLLRKRQHTALADALAGVVVDWASSRGRQHAGEIAELLGAQAHETARTE